MVKRKPIVLNAGQLEQLQSGDRLDLGNDIVRDNGNAGAIVIGQPVYATNGTDVDLAKADAQGTIRIAGLVYDVTVASGDPAVIITDGILVATTGQWDVVIGQVGGLTPGVDYFLSSVNAGKMVTSAPSTTGHFVVRVGHALSSTEFEIEVQQPIKL